MGKGYADAVSSEEKTLSLEAESCFEDRWRYVLKSYEVKRKLFVSLLSIKSSVLGRVETAGGVWIGARNTFFKAMSAIGVIEHSFLDAARPRL